MYLKLKKFGDLWEQGNRAVAGSGYGEKKVLVFHDCRYWKLFVSQWE